MRTVLMALGILGALIIVVVAIGYALPVGHVATQSETLRPSPDQVFATLVDVDGHPKWRSDLQSVEVVSNTSPKRWREIGSNGTITLEFVEVQPPSRLVSRIADPDLGFGGTWTYELMPEGSGTRLTITERGEVYNPLFRFMSRFVFGHTATMKKFLEDLKKQLG
jgi:uncharacterized protein YndB with AHSA1/START domain